MNKVAYLDGYLRGMQKRAQEPQRQGPGLYTVDRPVTGLITLQKKVKSMEGKVSPQTYAKMWAAVSKVPAYHRIIAYVAPKGTKIKGQAGKPYGPYSLFTFSMGGGEAPMAQAQDPTVLADVLISGMAAEELGKQRGKFNRSTSLLNEIQGGPAGEVTYSAYNPWIKDKQEAARKDLVKGVQTRKTGKWWAAKGLGAANTGANLYNKITGKRPAMAHASINFPVDYGTMQNPSQYNDVRIQRVPGESSPQALGQAHDLVEQRMKGYPWAHPGSDKGYSCIDYGNSVLCALKRKVPPIKGKLPWREVQERTAQPAPLSTPGRVWGNIRKQTKDLAVQAKKKIKTVTPQAIAEGP